VDLLQHALVETADGKDGMLDCWFRQADLEHQDSPKEGVEVSREGWSRDMLEEVKRALLVL
jgi:hypothetical protein